MSSTQEALKTALELALDCWACEGMLTNAVVLKMEAALASQPSKNWDEDAAHENGNYQCLCARCNSVFMGHKRRVVCKQCAHGSERDKALEEIAQWAKAYPLDIFPEPDWKRSAQVLKENGLSLDNISAANMRHVITHVKAMVDAALSNQQKGSE